MQEPALQHQLHSAYDEGPEVLHLPHFPCLPLPPFPT